jgi:hypothetical protein
MGTKHILWVGTLFFLVIVVLCVFTHGTGIPAELTEGANRVLSQHGGTQLDVRFDGQRAHITGPVADSSAMQSFVRLVEGMQGVVAVTHNMHVDTTLAPERLTPTVVEQ